MIYITGDTHRDFSGIHKFCVVNKTSVKDVLIILGDAGINYFGGRGDKILKEKIAQLPITLFCIHGNHENRPSNIHTYKIKQFWEGKVYIEPKYPNIIFPKDGEIFNIMGRFTLVIGGAQSVDKAHRLEQGHNWWADEQPSETIKFVTELNLDLVERKVDFVFSHTCPLNCIPQKRMSKILSHTDTEQWLAEIERTIKYKNWFCGHFHFNGSYKNIIFLYDQIEPFIV